MKDYHQCPLFIQSIFSSAKTRLHYKSLKIKFRNASIFNFIHGGKILTYCIKDLKKGVKT